MRITFIRLYVTLIVTYLVTLIVTPTYKTHIHLTMLHICDVCVCMYVYVVTLIVTRYVAATYPTPGGVPHPCGTPCMVIVVVVN